MAKSMKRNVIVIGAGVIGLQSALELVHRGYQVHIVAKHLPGDESVEYTSPWAGAHWRPHGLEDDLQQRQWDIETYAEWLRLVAEEDKLQLPAAQQSGISIVPSLLLWDSASHAEIQPTRDARSLWFAQETRDFQVCAPISSMQDVSSAARFTTLAINVPKYLNYLLSRFKLLGGTVTRYAAPTDQGLDSAITSILSILSEENTQNCIFINATGLGARHLVPDTKMYPARGQVVLIQGVAPECRTRQGSNYISYVIPRPDAGVSILGGCKEVGNWSGEEDEAMTEAILQRGRALVPELLREEGKFEVLGVQVGLRPGREGGARVEKEVREGGVVVVHAYGHGGAGFQNSVGVGRKVATLVEEGFEDSCF